MKRNEFNITAAFFGRFWFAYHFLFIELIIISIINIIVNSFATVSIFYFYDYYVQREIAIRIVSLILLIIKFFIFGFISNKVYINNEKRIDRCNFSIIKYLREHEKSIVFRGTAIVLYMIWIGLCDLTLMPQIVFYILY